MNKGGAWLKQARLDSRLSQKELADLAGLSQAYIHRLEDGDYSSPGRKGLRSIAAVIRKPPEEVLTAFGYQPGDDAVIDEDEVDMIRFRRLVGSLPAPRRRNILDALELLCADH